MSKNPGLDFKKFMESVRVRWFNELCIYSIESLQANEGDEQHEHLDAEERFYMIALAEDEKPRKEWDILYIGIAEDQTLRKRLLGHLANKAEPDAADVCIQDKINEATDATPVVVYGDFEGERKILFRDSLYKRTECCLIATNWSHEGTSRTMDLCNGHHKDGCESTIVVENLGNYLSLRKTSVCPFPAPEDLMIKLMTNQIYLDPAD